MRDVRTLGREAVALPSRAYRVVAKHVRHHNLHWWADPYRVLTRRFEKECASDQSNLTAIGNYFLDRRVPLRHDSVVYSAGVGTNIEFDLALVETFGCRVLMLDPTPTSIEFMEGGVSDSRLSFEPVGLWCEDAVIEFGRPSRLSSSASATGLSGAKPWFAAECQTVGTVMQRHGHSRIDVLKMDIEGAALPAMRKMLDDEIYPTQVVAEFERPRSGATAVCRFFADLADLCDRVRAIGYEVVLLPRGRARYYSVELLFVRGLEGVPCD